VRADLYDCHILFDIFIDFGIIYTVLLQNILFLLNLNSMLHFISIFVLWLLLLLELSLLQFQLTLLFYVEILLYRFILQEEINLGTVEFFYIDKNYYYEKYFSYRT